MLVIVRFTLNNDKTGSKGRGECLLLDHCTSVGVGGDTLCLTFGGSSLRKSVLPLLRTTSINISRRPLEINIGFKIILLSPVVLNSSPELFQSDQRIRTYVEFKVVFHHLGYGAFPSFFIKTLVSKHKTTLPPLRQ